MPCRAACTCARRRASGFQVKSERLASICKDAAKGEKRPWLGFVPEGLLQVKNARDLIVKWRGSGKGQTQSNDVMETEHACLGRSQWGRDVTAWPIAEVIIFRHTWPRI